MRQALAVVLSIVTALVACGGGGGGSGGSGGGDMLYVSVDYPNQAISLYEAVVVTPQLLGFQGRVPSCSLAQGAMPTGLQLRSDCSIAGRATQTAVNLVTIRVAASGVSNTVDMDKLIQVNGPTVSYASRVTLSSEPLGTLVDDTPSVLHWTAGADLSMSWSYRLDSGSLPPGVTLDPVSGRMSGSLQTAGVFSGLLRATLQTQFGTFESNPIGYGINVNVPAIRYTHGAAYVSEPFTATPFLQGTHLPDATLSNVSFSPALPPGLVANAAGAISGSPTAELPSPQTHTVTATLTQGGVSGTTQGNITLGVSSPVYIQYPSVNATVGTPIQLAPNVTQRIPLSPGVTMNYTRGASHCTLPPGVTIDGPTGVASGVSAITGAFYCDVDVAITNNGVSWTDSALLWFQVR